jgi:hypothetical protein
VFEFVDDTVVGPVDVAVVFAVDAAHHPLPHGDDQQRTGEDDDEQFQRGDTHDADSR